ncbi:MAG: GNAT family N-acetyltransferase [Oscillospiraceae bacterium]|nr:GNAT family N-acetyltransferase [Oscillospiraceae bacterium]
MIDFEIQPLSEENKHLIDDFSCVEPDIMLSGLNAKERRRVRKHSQDMENFLRNEAYEDQEKGLSRTYLFVYDSRLIAYLSLCNDAIRLEFEERDNMNLPYTTIPAVKVARLAVSAAYQGKGLGKEALQFAVYVSQLIRDQSGVVFLTLDCYEHRVGYYEQFGFRRNLYQPVILDYDSPVSMRLWIDEYLSEKTDEITE